MYNYLHLSRSGIPKLAEPLLEEIEMLLKNFLTADSASLGEPDNWHMTQYAPWGRKKEPIFFCVHLF